MKKKFIFMVLFAVLLLGLSSCVSEGAKNYESHAGLVAISGSDNLYYDTQTKVVYIVFNECTGYAGYGYMSAYYAPNGLPYLYDTFNCELVEISYTQNE